MSYQQRMLSLCQNDLKFPANMNDSFRMIGEEIVALPGMTSRTISEYLTVGNRLAADVIPLSASSSMHMAFIVKRRPLALLHYPSKAVVAMTLNGHDPGEIRAFLH